MNVKTFAANYGRDGTINIEKAVCDVCNLELECLTIDTSDGEYGYGAICKLCIDASFLNAVGVE